MWGIHYFAVKKIQCNFAIDKSQYGSIVTKSISQLKYKDTRKPRYIWSLKGQFRAFGQQSNVVIISSLPLLAVVNVVQMELLFYFMLKKLLELVSYQILQVEWNS